MDLEQTQHPKLKAKLFLAGWDKKESDCITEYMHLTAEGFDSMVTTTKQKSLTHIASWWFYCSSQMAFLKMNFNGQQRKNVLLYLCNWSLWNRIGKIHRITGHILYLVNHQASAINIAAFGNVDLYPAFAKNNRNCLGSQATWTISCEKLFFSWGISCSDVISGFIK